VSAIIASLGYLRAERWQESLQWGLMGLGLTFHALPEGLLPFARERLDRVALIFTASGAALFGYWVFEQWHG
jgi:hypothetical protein